MAISLAHFQLAEDVSRISASGWISKGRASCLKWRRGRPLSKRAGFSIQLGPSVVDAAAPTAVLILAAEAIGFVRVRDRRRRTDERRGGGEIRGAMMRRLMSGLVRGSAERGKGEERDGQN
jgi:hypothetical protein